MDNTIIIPSSSKLNITLLNNKPSSHHRSTSNTTVINEFKAKPKTWDAIVIGAGLSGLQAAVTLRKAGHSVLVLEATDRIGGKCYSVPNIPGSKTRIDLGGAWVNDTTQSHMWALGKRYGIQFEEQYTGGKGIFQFNDGSVFKGGLEDLPVSHKDITTINTLLDKITTTGTAIAEESYKGPISQTLDKILFQEWIDQETKCSSFVSWVMKFTTEASIGAGPTEYSALHILRFWQTIGGIKVATGSGKGTSLYLRTRNGAMDFANGLANELGHHHILLNNDVSAINQKHDTCEVTARNGTYHSKKVIVSIPSPLYSKISFTPELLDEKLAISNRTKMGYFTKVVLLYEKPWWREYDLNGAAVSTEGPISSVQDTCVMRDKQYSLSTFVGGPQGRKWAELPKEQRMKAVSDHVEKLYGSFVEGKIPTPLRMVEKDWTKDDWFGGAPNAVYPTNILNDGGFRAMREKHGNIHFVGTETSEEFEGYMEGAVRSGERGAKEVIEALKD